MRFINLAEPWAIELKSAYFYLGVYDSILTRKGAGEELDVEAIEAASGKEIGKKRTFQLENGVATIPIEGPIVKRADMFSQISGLTSTEAVRAQLEQAMTDPEVHSIILDIDSPGGQTSGTGDLAGAIHLAGKIKPIVAFADGMIASAAYWLGSAASEVVMSPTAIAGSIGTVMAWQDDTKKKEMAGIKDVKFISSQSPLKQVDHNTDAGKAQYQQIVDDATRVFARDVAKYRGVSVATVLKDFGQGGVMVGKRAVKAGLADRIGTLDGLKQELASGNYKPPIKTAAKPASGGTKMSFKDRVSALSALLGQDDDGADDGAPIQMQEAKLAIAQPATLAGYTEEQVKQMAAVVESQRQTMAMAFAQKYESRYLENGGKDDEGNPITSDRSRFTAAAVTMHLLAQKAGFTAQLEALMSVPSFSSKVRVAALTAVELEGASPVSASDPGEKFDADATASRIVAAGQGKTAAAKK